MVQMHVENYVRDKAAIEMRKQERENYLEKFLMEMDNVDPNKGVEYRTLASLENKRTNLIGKASQIAVVGFWNFNSKTATLGCDDFFYVPYPMTRQICSSKD